MARPDGKTNSIIRLRDILESAVAFRPKTGGQSKYRDAWASVFDVDEPRSESGTLLLFERLLQLRALFSEVLESIMSIDGLDPALYVQPIHAMSKIVANVTVLDEEWGGYTHLLNPANMTALKFAEDQLSKHEKFNEPIIPPDELESILTEANDLYNQVLDSKLSKPVKRILLDLIEDFRRAIHEYRVRGPKGLKDAMGKVIGVIATNQEEFEAHKDDKEFQAFTKLFNHVDRVYQVAVTAKGLYEAAVTFLPLLGTGSK